MGDITVVNATQSVAAEPLTLQNTGCFVSHGGTTLTAGSIQLLTAETDLASILTPAAALASLSWSGGTVSATTEAPLPFQIGDIVNLTIAGCTPSGYNGTFPCTITGASAFTYPLAGNPGSETVLGTYVSVSVAEVTDMNAEWWAQGSTLAVYVLELGALGSVNAIAALATYLEKYPNTEYEDGDVGYFYHYCVPPEWSSQSTYVTLVEEYEATNDMTYFDTTMTTGNYTSFAGVKSVIGEVQAPAAPATEFSVVATMFNVLNRNPSATNKATQFCYNFQFDVTVYPKAGNSTILAELKAAGVNIVKSAAEGGISNAMLAYGTTMDVNAIDYWYSIDWLILQSDLALTNAVINGSNDPLAPLYYDQAGINTLQSVEEGVCATGVSYGLLLGNPILVETDPTTFANNVTNGVYAGNIAINAVPFTTYVLLNPSNYQARKYGGLQVAFSPQLGFEQVIINLNAVQFP